MAEVTTLSGTATHCSLVSTTSGQMRDGQGSIHTTHTQYFRLNGRSVRYNSAGALSDNDNVTVAGEAFAQFRAYALHNHTSGLIYRAGTAWWLFGAVFFGLWAAFSVYFTLHEDNWYLVLLSALFLSGAIPCLRGFTIRARSNALLRASSPKDVVAWAVGSSVASALAFSIFVGLNADIAQSEAQASLGPATVAATPVATTFAPRTAAVDEENAKKAATRAIYRALDKNPCGVVSFLRTGQGAITPTGQKRQGPGKPPLPVCHVEAAGFMVDVIADKDQLVQMRRMGWRYPLMVGTMDPVRSH